MVLCSGAFCFFAMHRRWHMRILCCLSHHQVFKVWGESRCLKIGPGRRQRCGLVGVEQMIVSSMTSSMSGLKGSYQRGLKNRGLEPELKEVLLREAHRERSSKWLTRCWCGLSWSNYLSVQKLECSHGPGRQPYKWRGLWGGCGNMERPQKTVENCCYVRM